MDWIGLDLAVFSVFVSSLLLSCPFLPFQLAVRLPLSVRLSFFPFLFLFFFPFGSFPILLGVSGLHARLSLGRSGSALPRFPFAFVSPLTLTSTYRIVSYRIGIIALARNLAASSRSLKLLYTRSATISISLSIHLSVLNCIQRNTIHTYARTHCIPTASHPPSFALYFCFCFSLIFSSLLLLSSLPSLPLSLPTPPSRR